MSDPTLILSPITHPCHVPGSTQLQADCGHYCWVSPASVFHLASTPGTRTLCVACVDAAILQAVDDVHAIPGQRQELADALPDPVERAETLAIFDALTHPKENPT